jgi:predicted DsbA family dithiol-disulfide isomerase
MPDRPVDACAEVGVEVTEVTDPGCVWSWGSEPKLRWLRWHFGDRLRWRRVMGGQLRDLRVQRPDVDLRRDAEEFRAGWADVGRQTGAPWPGRLAQMHLSTLAACRAVKAAELQGDEVSGRVLRRLREAVFVHGRPVVDATTLAPVVRGVPGLDEGRLVADLGSALVAERLDADLDEARTPLPERFDLADGPVERRRVPDGERARYGFPTLIVRGPASTVVVTGWRPLSAYVEALDRAAPGVSERGRAVPDPTEALARLGSLTRPDLELLCEGAVPPPGTPVVETPGGPLYVSVPTDDTVDAGAPLLTARPS